MAKDSTGTILLLGAAGLAFYGYTQGWFNALLVSLGMPIPAGTINPNGPTIIDTVTGKTLTPAQQAALTAAAAAQTGSAATPAPTVPALGTTVTSAAQVAAQVGANDPYILPDATTYGAYSVSPPMGYASFNLTDKGNVLLRQDVANAANLQVGTTSNPISLTDLQALMSTKGLSGGLGDYRRHLYSRTGRA